MAIMPSVCADAYGPGNAANHGFMSIAYIAGSCSSAPVVSANRAWATTGSYSSAFLSPRCSSASSVCVVAGDVLR